MSTPSSKARSSDDMARLPLADFILSFVGSDSDCPGLSGVGYLSASAYGGVILRVTPTVWSSKQRLGLCPQIPAPASRNAGDRRIMRPTTDAESTVATRYKTPTAG